LAEPSETKYVSDPQAAVNSQLMEDYDLLIALIGDRLGEPTPRAESGTAEEIKNALDRKQDDFGGKHVQVIFRNRFEIDVRTFDPIQMQRVNEFKASLYSKVIVAEFGDPEEIDVIVKRFLEVSSSEFFSRAGKAE
jgi:hypothetical protein